MLLWLTNLVKIGFMQDSIIRRLDVADKDTIESKSDRHKTFVLAGLN